MFKLLNDTITSPLMRGRGLKQGCLKSESKAPKVAPHAGAWIETRTPLIGYKSTCVAPHAGAWIETTIMGIVDYISGVAPHAGAWIETYALKRGDGMELLSPLMRGRGLKHCS